MAEGKVFITGALGFIGRRLGEHYRERGVEVSGVDLRGEPGLGVVAGDVSAGGAWQERLAGCDLVIHTAAIVSNAGRAGRFWKLNVLGTRRVVDAAARHGARRLVHFSSVRAFGDLGFPDGVNEDHPVRPDGNAYVDTKIASEQVVLQAHAAGEVPVTIVRPADVYGPGSRPWTILPVEAIKARQFLLPAAGKGIFSPVYVDTLVEGVGLAAAKEEGAGQVFTLSDGIGVSTSEFFGHYARMLGVAPVRTVPTSVAVALANAAGAVDRLRGEKFSEAGGAGIRYLGARTGTYSIEKARRMLRFEPAITLDKGMELTEAWLRDQGML